MLIQVRVRAILQFYSNRKRASLFPSNRFCINSIFLAETKCRTALAHKKSFSVKNVSQSYDIKITHHSNFSLRFKKDKFRDQRGLTCTQSEKKKLETNGQKLKRFFRIPNEFLARNNLA